MQLRRLMNMWLGAIIGVLPVAAQTITTVSFIPIEDAYLEGNTRFNNTLLKIEPNRRVAYLKFNVSGTTENVARALLSMKVSGDAGSGTINFYAGSHNNWTETNITSASAPTKGALLGSMNGSFSLNQVYSVDVKDLLSNQGEGEYTIIAEMANGGNDVWFSSTEGSSDPTLEVTFDSGPPPPVTFTAYSESMDMDEDGWKFYWNAPTGWDIGVEGDLSTGEISDRSSWRPLIWSGSMWTADGDTIINNSPSRALRINASGGHAGYFGASSELDRYAISAFTIGQAGDYHLMLGKVGTSTNGNGVWVKIFLNGSLHDELLVPSAEIGDFSHIFNGLLHGDEIAVAVGPNGNSSNDTYTMDYRIALLKPEYDNPQMFRVTDYGAVGDGVKDDGPAVLEAIEDWKNAYGPATLYFEPGKFYFLGKQTESKAYFDLDGATQKVIEGNGSKWIFTPTNRGFNLTNCDYIVARNFTVDYSPLPFTQGTIIGKDSDAGTFKVRIMAGYDDPIVVQERNWGVVYDGSTGRMRTDVRDHTRCESVTDLGDGVFEFLVSSVHQDNIPQFQLGDLFACRSAELNGGVSGADVWAVIKGNGSIAFDNVTINAAPYFGFSPSENSKPCLFRNITISPPDDSNRLISSFGDGLHCGGSRFGPVIQGGYFTHVMDDTINMKATGFRVNQVINGTTLELDSEKILVGDVLQFVSVESDGLDRHDVIGLATVVSINGDQTVLNATPEGVVADDTIWVFNLSDANAGYLVQDCYFGPKRRYAGIIRCSDGKVLNNVAEFNDGWRIGNNLFNGVHEGPMGENILFQGNTVRNTRDGLHIRSLRDATRSPRPLKNIRVIDNVFIDNTLLASTPDLRVSDVSDLVIQGNQFSETPIASVDLSKEVVIAHNADINGNFIQDQLAVLSGGNSASEITVDLFDYTDWAEKAKLFGDAADVNQDADSDGMVNLMEYALGGNPLVVDNASVLPDLFITDGYVYFTHEERVDDSSLNYSIERSVNFESENWSPAGIESFSESATQNGFKTVTRRADLGNTEFFRLKVEQ